MFESTSRLRGLFARVSPSSHRSHFSRRRHQIRAASRKCFLENLETRMLLAGDAMTGLNTLVELIQDDPGLNYRIPTSEISTATEAANSMNGLIVEAIYATGVANDGLFDAFDLYDINAYLAAEHYEEWVLLHGDDSDVEETGFHLVQNDGANTQLFGGHNAVNTVADGVYHMGFEIVSGRFLNEDGNKNASVLSVAHWLNQLLEDDLAGQSDKLYNPAFIVDAQQIADARIFSVDEVVGPEDYREVPHEEALALSDGTVELTFVANDVSGRHTLFSKDARDYGEGGHLTAFLRDGRIEVRLQDTEQSVYVTSNSQYLRAGGGTPCRRQFRQRGLPPLRRRTTGSGADRFHDGHRHQYQQPGGGRQYLGSRRAAPRLDRRLL